MKTTVSTLDLLRLICKDVGIEAEVFPETTIQNQQKDEGTIDYLDFIDIIVEVQKEFRIKLPEDELRAVKNIDDLGALIDRMVE